MMTYNENKQKYNASYNKANYKRVPLDVRPEFYAKIQAAALRAGESVNGFIKRAVRERIERLEKETAPQDAPEDLPKE